MYNQGKKTTGDIVTNAKAGKSYHNYGLAIDVCEIKEGKANLSLDMYKKVAPYAKKEGFTWGEIGNLLKIILISIWLKARQHLIY